MARSSVDAWNLWEHGGSMVAGGASIHSPYTVHALNYGPFHHGHSFRHGSYQMHVLGARNRQVRWEHAPRPYARMGVSDIGGARLSEALSFWLIRYLAKACYLAGAPVC